MSGSSHEDPGRPLLQTVCHAGLLTLAALMADQAHQLPHLGLNSFPSLPLRQPSIRITDPKSLYARELEARRVKGGITQTEKNVEGQTNASTTRLFTDERDLCGEEEEGRGTENLQTDVPTKRLGTDEERNLAAEEAEEQDPSSLELPCAPIYSFDEDGDILQSIASVNVSDTQITFLDRDRTFQEREPLFPERERTFTDSATPGSEETEGCPITPCDLESTPTSPKTKALKEPSSPQKNQILKEEETIEEKNNDRTCSHPILASVGAPEDSVPHIDLAEQNNRQNDTTERHDILLPEVRVVSENFSVTPKINLQASSVEVEDDYLESHLDDDHLRDFCASLMAECGWQSPAPSTQGSVVGLLSVTPHDPVTKRTPRVPFDAVVFTERKPSTGDALVLSLGLSADGANTIQDIATRNQGAARERLQQSEVLPPEAKLTKQCESCGVSPEECLKKLGLHSDTVRPVASPKSERLLHFFKHIPADIQSRVAAVAAAAAVPLSQHEFEQAISSSKQKSRSLSSSPTNAEDDGRKSRLVAL